MPQSSDIHLEGSSGLRRLDHGESQNNQLGRNMAISSMFAPISVVSTGYR